MYACTYFLVKGKINVQYVQCVLENETLLTAGSEEFIESMQLM